MFKKTFFLINPNLTNKEMLNFEVLVVAFFFVVLNASISSADPNPYIRQGNTYLNQTGVLLAIIGQSSVYCDAFNTVGAQPDFDGIRWSVYSNGNVLYSNPVVTNNVTTQMYSLQFTPYRNMNADSLFSCCTTLNGVNVICKTTYVTVDPKYNFNSQNKLFSSVYLVFFVLVLNVGFFYNLI